MDWYDDVDPRRNYLLAGLPDEELERVLLYMKPVHQEVRDTVYDPNEVITHVYFPLHSVLSMVAEVDDGVTIEIGTVGYEGMAGLPAFLGATQSPHAAFCQIAGASGRMSVADLRQLTGSHGVLQRQLQRFTQATVAALSQGVACNRLHPTAERLARWLLTTRRRVGADVLPLTHGFLAQMLGARRATVALGAGMMQTAGLIDYRRGIITITDVEGLIDASCECYGIVEQEYDALLKPPA